jgi:hypothetical protein
MGSIASSALSMFTTKTPRYATWNVDDAKAAIANESQVRITTAVDEPNNTHRIFCPICYRYYSEINLTCCCQHQVCSLCFFAMKTLNQGDICPFCRCSCLTIRANIGVEELPNPGNQDDKAYVAFKEQTHAVNRNCDPY